MLLAWFVEPLRQLWTWLRMLPGPIQLGLGAAAVGFLLLLASLLWERLEDRDKDRALRDEP